jgi:thymidylate synthase
MNDPSGSETQYLELMKNVLSVRGEYRETRNGLVRSVFAPVPLTFDLSTGTMPILTTKKVSFRNVFYELMWFMKGHTDIRWLQDKGVAIWDGNAIAFGTTNLGPIYGHQFRRSGPSSVDQVATCLHQIRATPTSRRIVMTTWNPSDIKKMALPPCHGVTVQFYVREEKWLDLQMYQRSADICIGLPYNIISYSLMLLMFAHCTEYSPGKLTIVLGDAHIYQVHQQTAKEQTLRNPKPSPQIRIRDAVQRQDPSEFEFEDFVLTDYSHHGVYKYDFVV